MTLRSRRKLARVFVWRLAGDTQTAGRRKHVPHQNGLLNSITQARARVTLRGRIRQGPATGSFARVRGRGRGWRFAGDAWRRSCSMRLEEVTWMILTVVLCMVCVAAGAGRGACEMLGTRTHAQGVLRAAQLGCRGGTHIPLNEAHTHTQARVRARRAGMTLRCTFSVDAPK